MKLQLILQKPVEELIPAMIAFNNAEMLLEIKTRLTAYKGKTYDDNSISEAKADRAKLNSVVKAIDAERIRINKAYLEPYNKFKVQVDEITKAVSEVSAEIDAQVKAYEIKTDKQKREEITAMYDRLVAETGVNNIGVLDMIWDSRWLNTTYRLPKIEEEIRARLIQIDADVKIIDAYKGDYKDAVRDKYLQTYSLSDALAEDARLTAQKAERERLTARAAQVEKPVETPITKPSVVNDCTEELQQLDFRVWVTSEQREALKAFLKSNNIKYGKVE